MKAVYSNNLFDDNPEVTHMQVIHQSMPDMQMFDKLKRHRRHENAPLVDLQ